MIRAVDIDSLVLDPSIQPRAALNYSVVEEYAELYRRGIAMPPPVIFAVDKKLLVADGFHRVSGAQSAGIESLQAEIRSGTRDDAKWYAAGANLSHGLPRTPTDKRRAVASALGNSKAKNLSDRAVAEHCGVGKDLVGDVRRELSAKDSSVTPDKRTGKDGKRRGERKDSKKKKAEEKRRKQTEKATKAAAEKRAQRTDALPVETPSPSPSPISAEEANVSPSPHYDHVVTLALQLPRFQKETLIRMLQRSLDG